MKNVKIMKTVGELELMAAAAEPGVVMTEEMSIICCKILIRAAKQLKDNLLTG